jgi:hypothetical protein
MVRDVKTKQGNTRRESHHDCPFCGATNGLSIIGSRAASLSSVVIGTLFGSAYNSDRKLITFSDSVQDAAHRAGFFGARTFRNTLRTALAQYLETQGNGQSLDQVVSGFQRHWRNQLGSDADYIATFMPTDMQWLGEWEALLNTGKVAPRLLEFIDQRLHWEIIADAGLRSTIGRSLEQVGACSIGLHSKFGSAYNSDRKLITFSDSVQDAAHRAGFFGARTFRNTLRTALAQYLETQGNGQSLDQVVSGFQRHWRNQLGSDGRLYRHLHAYGYAVAGRVGSVA